MGMNVCIYKKCLGTLLITLALAACGSGNQSAVEGKLVDWNGNPVAGVKVTATQQQPLKGYEQFEAVTKADGSFRIGGLYPSAPGAGYPSSLYEIKPRSDKWTCDTSIVIPSPPQGETAVLPEPMTIQQVYTKSTPRLIADITTGQRAKTSVEGRLLDWNELPARNVKVMAYSKDHGQFESVTDETGAFLLEGLFANAEYTLYPWSEKWTCETSVRINSARFHGDVVRLGKDIVMTYAISNENNSVVGELYTGAARFASLGDGVIADSQTGLEWVVGPDRQANYARAEQWLRECKIAGGGWRMPNRNELETLHLRGVGKWNMDHLFGDTGGSVWAEPIDSSSICYFSFRDGRERCSARTDSIVTRLLGVRLSGSVQAGGLHSEEQVSDLPPRFAVSAEGVIADSQTGIEWLVGPDRNMNYAQAEQWVAECTLAGGGWRMPTRTELRELYQWGAGTRNMDPAFQTTGWLVWAEPRGSSSAWSFNFYRDGSDSEHHRGYSVNLRAFGARSPSLKSDAPATPDASVPDEGAKANDAPATASDVADDSSELVARANDYLAKGEGDQAYSLYQQAANSGNAEAMFMLGVVLDNGWGAAMDQAESMRWYREAAELGNSQAMLSLAGMYRYGRGGVKDEAEAVRWYRKAADLGDTQAMLDLGWMCAYGMLGVAEDEAEAVRWYRKAADLGDARGMGLLGRMFADGRGVAKDEVKAVHWYRKAADLEDTQAMVHLALMYDKGRGVSKDGEEAARWTRKAADLGDAEAMLNLGWRHEEGRGVQKDPQSAVEWWKSAAQAGSQSAQKILRERGIAW